VKAVCDAGGGVGPGGNGVYLDFAEVLRRVGQDAVRDLYGNLFEMYERITGEDPYRAPMRIYPAIHYTMGGLWVDYDLMSTIPGLFVLGEANFSDHGANRLGASALMQGLADGYFIIPYTLGSYFAAGTPEKITTDHEAFRQAESQVQERVAKLLAIKGKKTAVELHRELGKVMWEHCGMARTRQSLELTIARVAELRAEFWQSVNVPGSDADLNMALERAGRVADFMEFAELLARDALAREESCGSHLREEYQYPDGEAKRDDEHFSHVAAWQFAGDQREPVRLTEPLPWEAVHPSVRSYK
jgi:succinate dehydrogenase / fumarate reductase flavoprotein subunit